MDESDQRRALQYVMERNLRKLLCKAGKIPHNDEGYKLVYEVVIKSIDKFIT